MDRLTKLAALCGYRPSEVELKIPREGDRGYIFNLQEGLGLEYWFEDGQLVLKTLGVDRVANLCEGLHREAVQRAYEQVVEARYDDDMTEAERWIEEALRDV